MTKVGDIIDNMVPEFDGFSKDAPKKEQPTGEAYSIDSSFSGPPENVKNPVSVQFILSILLLIGMIVANVGVWLYSSVVLSSKIDAEFSKIDRNSEVLDIPQIQKLIAFNEQLNSVRVIFDLRPNLLGVLSSIEHSLYSESSLDNMTITFNNGQYNVILKGGTSSLVKYIEMARSLQDNTLFSGGAIQFSGGGSGALQSDSDKSVDFTYSKGIHSGELDLYLNGIRTAGDSVVPTTSAQERFLEEETKEKQDEVVVKPPEETQQPEETVPEIEEKPKEIVPEVETPQSEKETQEEVEPETDEAPSGLPRPFKGTPDNI